MPEKQEIGTRLTLDDAASEALKKIQEGFHHVGEKAREVGREMLSMAKQAAAVAIGFQLNGLIDGFREFGHELVAGAAHLENQKKELAGMISLADKGEQSLDELGGRASELNEHFERLGITMGISKESLIDAFETIAERSTKGSQHVEDMVTNMSQAARILPGGMSTLSNAFRDLESGIVRPKNALVALMRQTGVATGSAKAIAQGISGLLQTGGEAGQQKVMKLAEEAISRMSAKMAKVPQTFTEVLQSMRGFREMFLETMGQPILRALVPQFDRLRQYLVGHREEIERLAETMGGRVGQWVEKAAEMIKEGFEYIQSHSKEIFEALEGGANALKSAVSFLVQHKELILGLATARFASNVLGGVAGALPGIGAVAGGVAGNLGKGAGMLGNALAKGAPGVGMAAGSGALATSFAAAGLMTADVMIWKKVFDDASALERESGLSSLQTIKHLVGIGGSLSAASDRMISFNAVMKRFQESDFETTGEELGKFADQIERLGEAAVDAGDMTRDELNRIESSTRQRLATESQARIFLDQMASASAQAFGTVGMGLGASLGRFTDAFKEANDANAKEALQQAKNILGANDALRMALAGAGGTVEEALNKLKALASGGVEGGGVKLPAINFGPSNFSIRQDFRSVDPDRVALIFRNDVTKHAISRIMAKTGSAFGF